MTTRNGNGYEGRLRKAENDITALRTDMKHKATEAWVYGRILAISAAASSIAVLIARLIPG